MASRKAEKERARQERLRLEAERAAAERRRRQLTIGGSVLGVLVAIVVVVVIVSAGGGSNSSASAQLSKAGSTPVLKTGSLASLGSLQPAPSAGAAGPEGIPIERAPTLAGTGSMANGSTVDGVGCLGQEQTLFHIHARLTIFINGSQRSVPYGVGITGGQAQQTPQGPFVGSGTCYYWLHTHATDGIIHVESPVQRTFTLGNFFDIWGQPLNSGQVGPARGTVTAMYNGQLYVGNPRNIPLNAHAQIQLEVGKPLVAPISISSWAGL